jgi:hypothetical protein
MAHRGAKRLSIASAFRRRRAAAVSAEEPDGDEGTQKESELA